MSPKFKPLDRPKNLEEVKAAGADAARVLESTAFTLAFRAVQDDLLREIASTEPHERERRDWLYNQIYAMGTVVHKFASYHRAAEAADEALHAEERASQEEHMHQRRQLQ